MVIPAKNEAANIPWVLRRIPDFVDEIIVVDGLSTDGTLDVARAVRPDVITVHEERPGKGAALRAGFDVARGDFIVILDADGSMEPGNIGDFIVALESGYDMVKGSRYLGGGGSTDLTLVRSLGNRALRDIANLLYGTSFTELCYGYLAFRREALTALSLDADGFEIEAQLVARAVRAGLLVGEIPSIEKERLHGVSNLHPFRDGFRVLRELIRVRIMDAPVTTVARTLSREPSDS